MDVHQVESESLPAAALWRSMDSAPLDRLVLLRVPTRSGKYAPQIAISGRWMGGYWVTLNPDEAVCRSEPTGWLPDPALAAPALSLAERFDEMIQIFGKPAAPDGVPSTLDRINPKE